MREKEITEVRKELDNNIKMLFDPTKNKKHKKKTSNKSKQKECIPELYGTHNTSISVFLTYKNQVISVVTVVGTHNTDVLRTNVIKQYSKKLSHYEIIGFQATNLLLDYFLSLDAKKLKDCPTKITVSPLFKQINLVALENYDIIKLIGVGGFARVFLAKRKDNGKYFAIKLIEKKQVQNEERLEMILNQRNVMVNFDSPYLVKLHQCFPTRLYFCFVLEYCHGGELSYHIKQRKRFSQKEIQFYSFQILKGIEYVHKKNIVYRDLKPQNILLDEDGHVKIADFGLSKILTKTHPKTDSFCGSHPYVAPEVLKKQLYGFSVDFYSLGTVILQMALGSIVSFDTENLNQIIQQNFSTPSKQIITTQGINIMAEMSKELKSLLKGLLKKDVKQRLGFIKGAEQILAHKFFMNLNHSDFMTKKVEAPIKPSLFEFNVKVNDQEKIFKKFKQELREQYKQEKFVIPEFTYRRRQKSRCHTAPTNHPDLLFGFKANSRSKKLKEKEKTNSKKKEYFEMITNNSYLKKSIEKLTKEFKRCESQGSINKIANKLKGSSNKKESNSQSKNYSNFNNYQLHPIHTEPSSQTPPDKSSNEIANNYFTDEKYTNNQNHTKNISSTNNYFDINKLNKSQKMLLKQVSFVKLYQEKFI